MKFRGNLVDVSERNISASSAALSGGERQRIGIARAIVRNCNVLIFDESTSNLDAKTTQDLILLIKEIARKKLVIFVSHDPVVIKAADQILSL